MLNQGLTTLAVLKNHAWKTNKSLPSDNPADASTGMRTPQDVRAAVEEVPRHDGPALLDVVSARQELVLPPTTTFDEAHKFGMFMIKAVLDGRVRLLIDLADVNLRG